MKLIKSSFEILEQSPGLEGIYESIERAGRVCYKSERPEGKTAKDFVDMLIKRGHLSPLEHGTIYLKVPRNGTMFDYWTKVPSDFNKLWCRAICTLADDYVYVTTNYRHIIENDLQAYLAFLCEPTEYHERRVSVRINCSIGISREWNRHRALATTEDLKSINGLEFSVCEQSTRYCNYSKDKFANQVTFVIPSWVSTIEPGVYEKIPTDCFPDEFGWARAMKDCEEKYLALVKYHRTPQEAREV